MENKMPAASDVRKEPALIREEPRLVPKEEHFRIPSPEDNLRLFLRYLPPADKTGTAIVLYIHGATFPSAPSIAHRFDGRSWRDELCDAGFHVWGWIFRATEAPIDIPKWLLPPISAPLRAGSRMRLNRLKRETTISGGTHLMHLERSRYALYRETETFLLGKDEPAERSDQKGNAGIDALE
jgi:hypothetical protein